MNSDSPFHRYARETQQPPKNGEPTSTTPFHQASAVLPKEESYGEFGLRTAARLGSRIGETIVGAPGSTYQLAKTGTEYLANKLGLKKGEETAGSKLIKGLFEKLPTIESLQKFSEEKSKGYTSPQGDWEKLGDDLLGLATSLAIPAKNPTKLYDFSKTVALNLPKSLLKSAVAKTAGHGVKALGGGVGSQVATEVGTLVLLGAAGLPGARNFVNTKYRAARDAISPGTLLPTGGLVQDLNALEKDLTGLLTGPSSEKVLPKVKQLRDSVSTGQADAHEIVDAYHTVNEIKRDRGLFKDLSSADKKMFRLKLDKLSEALRKPIEQFGKHNKEFYREWSEANRAYKTMNEFQSVGDFLNSDNIAKLASPYAAYDAVKNFFVMSPFEAIGMASGAGTKLAATTAAAKAVQVTYRMLRDPTLRKHYMGVIGEAAKQNSLGTVREIEKLDKELKKRGLNPPGSRTF